MNKYFLSCDWGTSSFRLRLVTVDSGTVMYEQSTNQGIATAYAQWTQAGKVESNRMEYYLAIIHQQCKNIAAAAGIFIEEIPIIISGMASSSIGMLELPYTQMPFAVNGNDLQIKEIKKTASFPNDIILISGARTATDVMRGEETQLIGSFNDNNSGSQLFIFPGTHSKHIWVADEKALRVETFMTGEFFELLTTKSILSTSIEVGGDIGDEKIKAAFNGGVKESANKNLLHSSFFVRTNQLFEKYPRQANYFYLSGLLIGTELNQLVKKKASNIILLGDKKLQVNYLLALQLLGIGSNVKMIDDAAATVKGQLAIYKQVYK